MSEQHIFSEDEIRSKIIPVLKMSQQKPTRYLVRVYESNHGLPVLSVFGADAEDALCLALISLPSRPRISRWLKWMRRADQILFHLRQRSARFAKGGLE